MSCLAEFEPTPRCQQGLTYLECVLGGALLGTWVAVIAALVQA